MPELEAEFRSAGYSSSARPSKAAPLEAPSSRVEIDNVDHKDRTFSLGTACIFEFYSCLGRGSSASAHSIHAQMHTTVSLAYLISEFTPAIELPVMADLRFIFDLERGFLNSRAVASLVLLLLLKLVLGNLRAFALMLFGCSLLPACHIAVGHILIVVSTATTRRHMS